MKKLLIKISIIFIILIGGIFCYAKPISPFDLDPEYVQEISIFDGSTGILSNITRKENITHIINNLNTIKLKRNGISFGYMGYSFNITIHLSNNDKLMRWDNFIINSEEAIRKDLFFYKVVEGSIDYEYISTLIKE